MPYFAYKLFAPRPTFPQDMSAKEAAIMGEHVAYWTKLAKQGTAVAFRPVHDRPASGASPSSRPSPPRRPSRCAPPTRPS